MARPFKQGSDYYPEFVNEFEKNDILQDVSSEYGPLGESVYKRISNWVFAEGYYMEYDINQLAKKLRNSIGSKWISNCNKIVEIINYLADIGFIDKSLLANGVITSINFQKTYLFLVERRKNIDTSKYWLLETRPSLNTSTKVDNDNNNPINVNNNLDNVDNNTQTKSNQIKSNRINKINKYDKEFDLSEFNFLTRILIDNGLTNISDIDLMEYDSFLEKQINCGHNKKDLLRVVNYVVKHMITKKDEIDNKVAYFIKSFNVGLNGLTNKKDFNMTDFIKSITTKMKI